MRIVSLVSKKRASKEVDGVRVPLWVDALTDLEYAKPADLIIQDPATETLKRYLSQVSRVLDKLTGDWKQAAELAITGIQTPVGSVFKSSTEGIPSRITLSTQDMGWADKTASRGIDHPALIRVDAGPMWSRLALEQREEVADALRVMLEDTGVSVYGGIGSGASDHMTLKVALDQSAPRGDAFNLDLESGDYIPAAMGSNVKGMTPGKMMKRDKSDTPGGDHHYAEYPEDWDYERQSIPIRGKGGTTILNYEVMSHATTSRYRDANGNAVMDVDGSPLERSADITDGGGDIRKSDARRLYRATTGLEWDESIYLIQVNWQGRQYMDPTEGQVIGGTFKAMLSVVPDTEYDQMLGPGKEDVSFRISKEGMANQLANDDVSHGRTIFHRSKRHPWHWTGFDGLVSLPAIDRYFDLDQLGQLHFEYATTEAYWGPDRAIEQMPAALEQIDRSMPRGLDDNGLLDSLDDQYLENVNEQKGVIQRYENSKWAIRTGSPYASPGALEATSSNMGAKLRRLEKRGKGAGELFVPIFSGKQTAALNLPGNPEPVEGEIRLLSRRFRDNDGHPVYANHVVFNNQDMVDPEQFLAHGGPDNDDEYRVILGRDPDTGDIKAFASRGVIAPGGGRLYNVHPDDARFLERSGIPIPELRPNAAVDGPIHPAMADFDRRGGGFKPSEYPAEVTTVIARDMISNNAETAIKAKMKFLSIVTGSSRVGILTDMVGIAQRSGWLNTPAEWEEWAIDLHTALDTELFGTGSNEEMAELIAKRITEKVKSGRSIDRGLLEGRPGVTRMLAHTYAVGVVETSPLSQTNARQVYQEAVQEFNAMLERQKVTLVKWQEVDQWIDSSERAVRHIENVQGALANGPVAWLRARVARNPLKFGKYILPEVDELGKALSDGWRQVYRENKLFLDEEFVRRGWAGAGPSAGILKSRQELTEYYTTVMWQKIDRMVETAMQEALGLEGYRPGMLTASLTQSELRIRSLWNLDEPITFVDDEVMFSRLTSRVMQKFPDREQAGFFFETPATVTRPVTVPPTIVVRYEGEPWNQVNRTTGDVYDVRNTRRARSKVRYHAEGHVRGLRNLMGPFTEISGIRMTETLKMLSSWGAEFEYRGDLGNRADKVGIWQVHMNDPETGVPITNAQIKEWMKGRYYWNIPDGQLLPIWAPVADMQKLAYEFVAAGGRTAIVSADTIDYEEWDNNRIEWEDRAYSEPLPEHLKPHIPDEMEKISQEIKGEVLAPEVPGEDINLDADRIVDRETGEIIEKRRANSKAVQDSVDQAVGQEVFDRQEVNKVMDNADMFKQYQRPRPFMDPDMNPRRVNKVGARTDSYILFQNLMDEMDEFYSWLDPDSPARRRVVGTGTYDDLWYSPTLGTYTTTKDVARAYQDLARWEVARTSPLAAPGLARAVNRSEAAGILLQDLTTRATERFYRNQELGFWERIEVDNDWLRANNRNPDRYDRETGKFYVWEHSRGKTMDIRTRVRPRLGLSIPTPVAGFDWKPNITYYGNRRYPFIAKVKKYMEKLSTLESIELFDGDTAKALNATPAQKEAELRRVQDAQQRNRVKMVMTYLVSRDLEGFMVTRRGDKWTPGLLHAADELVDLGIDIKEIATYASKLLQGAEGDQIESLVRLMIRTGAEEMLHGVGIETVNVADVASRWNTGDIGSIPPTERMGVRQSPKFWEQDYAEFKSISRSISRALDRGDWTYAGAETSRLKNLKIVQAIRSHTVIYTQITPSDYSGRSIGRILPIVGERLGGIHVAGMIDINTFMDDRSINNAVNQIKFAMGKLLQENIGMISRDAYQFVQGAKASGKAAEQKFSNTYGWNINLVDRLAPEVEPYYRQRKKGGFVFKNVLRVNWYTMLTKGLGAAALSQALYKRDVPMEKRWLLNNRRNADWACRNNAGQGWVRNNQDFNTGHSRPPAHPGCRCRLEVRLTKQTDGSMNGMVKPLTRPRFINLNRRGRRSPNMDPMRIPRMPEVNRTVDS